MLWKLKYVYDCFLNSNDYEFKDHKQRISSYTKKRQKTFFRQKKFYYQDHAM